MFRDETETKNNSRKVLKKNQWWSNLIKKLNKIKCPGMKSRIKTSKNIKNKANNNKKNEDQN